MGLSDAWYLQKMYMCGYKQVTGSVLDKKQIGQRCEE